MLHTVLLSFLAPGAGFLILTAPAQPQNTAPRPVAIETAASLPPGLSWSDIDGDGRLDALSVTPEGRLRLVANRAEGSFEDVTQSAGLGAIDAVSLALWGDYDGDGRGDLFVGTRAGASLLLRNDAGHFVDMAAGAGLVIEEPVRAAHWLDEDGDGRLDLHVVTSQSNRVWRGLEGGFFEPVELPLEAFGDVSAPVVPLPSGVAGSPDRDVSGDLGPKTSPTSGVTPSAGGASQPLVGPPPLIGGATPIVPFPSGCADSIRDQANPGTCLMASSTATLGRLYPLSSKLFVSEATGNVGIGTASPSYRLHVNGKIVSGASNSALGVDAAVGGGRSNSAGGSWATIAGGRNNLASGDSSTYNSIGGGHGNYAGGYYGECNTVAGGANNEAGGYYATSNTIGGGGHNTAGGYSSLGNTVGGGDGNTAGGTFVRFATVGGGVSNSATGNNASVPGGISNAASGGYSFAAGRRAKATHLGAFVWGDGQPVDKPSSAMDEFNVYAEGGMRVFAAGVAAPSMVVDNAGSVGVGTATPQAPLHVEGIIRSSGAAGGSIASFNPQNQNASVTFSWLSDVARIRVGGSGAGSANGFDFQRIGDQSLMRLLDNGNVGIGTTTPAFDLEVNGTAGKPGGGSWSVASDARLKKNVEELEGALATLLALRGVSFEYIDPAAVGELEGRRIGFLAQEVERVLPDWVGEKENGTKYLTIRGFEALAVEALRELERSNEELQLANSARDARIAELEARIERLESVEAKVAALETLLADGR